MNCVEDEEVLEVSKNQDVADVALNHLNIDIPELTVETPDNRLFYPITDKNGLYFSLHSVSNSNFFKTKKKENDANFLFRGYKLKKSPVVKTQSLVVETKVLEEKKSPCIVGETEVLEEEDSPSDSADNKSNNSDFPSRLFLPSAVPDPEEMFFT